LGVFRQLGYDRALFAFQTGKELAQTGLFASTFLAESLSKKANDYSSAIGSVLRLADESGIAETGFFGRVPTKRNCFQFSQP
jgi:hypothetical protein